MSPALTRRVFAKAGAVALGAAVAGIPASASASTPDAELFRLLDSYPAAVAAMRLAGDRCEALWDALSAEEPDRPEALHTRPDDNFGIDCDAYQLRDGRRVRIYDLAEVEQLRGMPLLIRREWEGEPAPWDPREQVGRWVSVPDKQRMARRAEILAAHDAWFAAYQVVQDRLGIPAADAADDLATNALWDLEAVILATVPKTLAGLAAKAHWVARCRRGSVSAADWQKRIVEDVIALAQHGGETA